jgi:hypothetical protein
MQTPEQSAEEIFQQEKQESYSDEDILKGIIYPPPPSFYQRQQAVQQKQPERSIPPIPYIPEAAQAKTSYVPPKVAPTAKFAQIPTSAQKHTQSSRNKQAPAKKSRKWIWIVASILAASLVISCSLCGWAGYNLFSTQFQEALGARDCVNNYYGDMQAKNYAHAYTYLALTNGQSGLTQAQFIQQATQQDNTYGPILSYTPDTPTFSADTSQGTDINQSTVTVAIGRKQKQYTVTLTLHREGNIGKIGEYSNL